MNKKVIKKQNKKQKQKNKKTVFCGTMAKYQYRTASKFSILHATIEVFYIDNIEHLVSLSTQVLVSNGIDVIDTSRDYRYVLHR